MLKATKSLFESDEAVRKINRKANEIFINQLLKEDLDLKEKEHIAELAKKTLAKDDEFEERNCHFWYKYGLEEGKVKGVWIGAASLAFGYVVGALIRKK